MHAAARPRDRHVVSFYEHDGFLIESVVDFLRPALAGGQPSLVIATPEHREAIERAVADLSGATGAPPGSLDLLDADRLLTTFMVDGTPDPVRFEAEIGGLLDRKATSGVPVRVFGEMVALLWERGNVIAALAVEELWNELAESREFELLCGYPMATFGREDEAAGFPDVCERHTRVIPTESYSKLADPDARLRAIALLQHERESGGRERQALRAGHRELEAALARLQELERLRQQFVAMLVHDIRGPAVVIGASLRLLEEEWGEIDSESARVLIEGAVNSTERIERLAADVLTMARLEAGEFSYHLVPLDLDALVDQVAGQVMAATGRSINVERRPLALPKVRADEQRQMQILTNLLSNAVKFSPESSPVTVTLTAEADQVVVSVRDEGVGIAEQDLPRLFQPFSRLRPEDMSADGSGLGLYTTKALVEGQGGSMRVDSQAGHGSTFSFTVPLAEPR